jgi:hypothetical protein
MASPITPGRSAGTDYVGPNISVHEVAASQDCCGLCSTNSNCSFAVWYNHEPQLCALKADIEEQKAQKGTRCDALLPISGYTPPPPPPASFRFSNIYTSHAVLQSAPARSRVWGFCDIGDSVTVSIGGAPPMPTNTPQPGRWSITLPATKASFAPVAISAHSNVLGTTVTLDDLLFGDVWVCS